MTRREVESVEDRIREHLRRDDLDSAVELLRALSPGDALDLLDRSEPRMVPVLFRLLDKSTAVHVFAAMETGQQSDLVRQLQDGQVQDLFAELRVSGQARLLDEMPATVAVALENLRDHGGREQAAIVSVPVVSPQARLTGVVDVSVLVTQPLDARVAEIMREPVSAVATEDAEEVARLCADRRLWTVPVTDSEGRLIGVFTVADALEVLDEESTEDAARAGGVEPLGRPYLATSVLALMRSRITWLLVLAIGATLTVQVLGVFEETLEEMVVLSLFIPLIIGTGGNTGNQAATTVTRALALDDVRPRDAPRVMVRELRVGMALGGCIGLLGLVLAGLVFSWPVGLVIGATLFTVCAFAATVGGLMPLAARTIGADPAVFSNPFISTLVDALGLVVYFFIAQAVLGI
ncbi:magnesium transporter [Micrococcus luteus]|uniref:magnesium transporter n=1 Tax=Micrococcus luteus TaxID=1270 RepID=UPI0035194A1B